MKITMEVNDVVAKKLVAWGKENFGEEICTTMEDLIQELVIDMLVQYDADPDDYDVSNPPTQFPFLFTPSAEFDSDGNVICE